MSSSLFLQCKNFLVGLVVVAFVLEKNEKQLELGFQLDLIHVFLPFAKIMPHFYAMLIVYEENIFINSKTDCATHQGA